MVTERGFLVGAERSGTTMLRLMLSHHRELSWLPEFEFVVDDVPAPGRWPDLLEFSKKLTGDVAISEFLAFLGIHVDSSRSYPELVDGFLQQVQRREGSRICGATVHRNFDKLVSIWPDAKYIHIVRDGRDVASSRIGMGWAGNVWTAAPIWVETEESWERVAKQSLRDDQVLDVRFESLVSEPSRVLEDICDFLGVDYDPDMLSYPETATYAQPDRNIAQKWRKRLSARDIRRVEAVQRDMLAARGYELSGLPPLEIGILERIFLRAQCRFARILLRLRRQGLALFISDYFSRRLPVSSAWRRRVDIRRYENGRLYIK